jgi:hypothetical protein
LNGFDYPALGQGNEDVNGGSFNDGDQEIGCLMLVGQ